MKAGACPNCDQSVDIGESPMVGSYVRCHSCGVELIVVWLNPPELDFTYYSEDGYIYEDYRDNER
jgi:lysine biosynthesis protein LysW